MGCAHSRESPQVAQTQRIQRVLSSKSGQLVKLDMNDPMTEILIQFTTITEGVESIICPPGMVPIAILEQQCFCIATAALTINEDEQTNVRLPIIAASIAKPGKLLCLGHIQMLSNYYISKNSYSTFFHNLFIWLTSKQLLSSNVLLLNINERYESQLVKIVRALGFIVDKGDFKKDFSRYNLIICASTLKMTPEEMDKFLRYANNGGSICCCYCPSFSTQEECFNINSFLLEFGLSFMDCSINSETSEPIKTNIPVTYDLVKNKPLSLMVNTFKEMMALNNFNSETIDDFVTELRYVCLSCKGRYSNVLCDILSACWDYLNQTNIRNEDGFLDPNIIQNIIIVLIIDVYNQLPIDKLSVIPDCSTFPGLAKIREFKEYTIEIPIHEQTLHSTGLWLPPGVTATCKIEDNFTDNIAIQIGAHSQSLVSQPPPWKRWPHVVMAYKVNNGVTEIFSQVGGMVYIGVAETSVSALKMTFTNCALYPRAIRSDPKIFEQTQNFDVPWSEISANNVTFVLPTVEFKKIYDMNEIFKYYDDYIEIVAKIMNYNIPRPFRVVFDVQTPDDLPVPGYPITIPIDSINNLFYNLEEPNCDLFDLLTSIATSCLREGYFDSETERALSQIVIAQIFMDKYDGFDVESDESFQVTQLFHELWRIHRKINNTALFQIIRESMSPDGPEYYDDEERWTAFTRDLSHITQLNLTKIFERLKRIPLNISANLEMFPACPDD